MDSRQAFLETHKPNRWSRFLAALIDLPCMMVVAAGLNALSGWADKDPVFGPVLVMLLSVVIYHSLCESVLQATAGKKVLGLRTVTFSGARMSVVVVFLRSWTRLAGWMLMGIPHLVCALTPRQAMLHDLVTRTCTVRLDAASDTSPAGSTQIARWSWRAKVLAGSVHLFIACVIVGFAYLMYITSFIREQVTVAFDELKPTMKLIKDYEASKGAFPKDFEQIGGKPFLQAQYLKDVMYAPQAGTLILQFRPELGIHGAMFIAPLKKTDSPSTEATEWICGGSAGFLQSFLPRECLSMGELAIRQLRQQAAAKAKEN